MSDKELQPKDPIRVLFVNTRSAIGADVAVHLTLIENFDPRDCSVTIATNNQAGDFPRLAGILAGVEAVRVVPMNLGNAMSGRRGAAKLAGAAGNAATMLVALVRLCWLVLSRRIEVIHCTDRPRDAVLAALLSKITRRRCLIHLHIAWTGAEMGRATNWGVRHCDGILGISDFVRRSLVDRGIPAEKVHTVYNATDSRRYDPKSTPTGSLRKRLNIPPHTPVVGVIGRIMVWKGQLDLVEALPIVRESFQDVRLAIVGNEDSLLGASASYAGRIKKRAEELGVADAVGFAGWFDNSAEAFADMDVVCVPSTEEPFGLVVTEAMAMEKAVVGYDSGALPEIIRTGREGILVPLRDTRALAEAIVQLLGDPSLRAEMGRQGRERCVSTFNPRRQADDVAAVYRAMCRQNTESEAPIESQSASLQ